VTAWLDTSPMRFRTIDGLSIRFAESEGRGEHALLLSPWLESLLAFEPTWARLAEHAHLVAIDLPGFGHSERRNELLSPPMGEFVMRVADTFGLESPHVVGPDVGTGASLFAAALYPGRLRSLVIGSGGAAFPLQLRGALKEWVEAPDLERFRGADPRQIVAGALTADIERYPLPDAIREDYLSSYEGDRFVESMRYVRTYPTELAALGGLLPEIRTPVQIICGRQDPVVPPVNGEFLHERLPHSKLDILETGHFTWEDGADEYAALVTSWWAGGYATTAGSHA
jgi:pimeloyl-ACP methyl ester carboxylesterase